MKKIPKYIFVCAVALGLNILTVILFFNVLHVPLFLDTIFSVAVTFYAGLLPGLFVQIAYNVLITFIMPEFANELSLFQIMFAVCGTLIILITWAIGKNKQEFNISPAITALYLVLIAMLSSASSVISGGIIDYIRYEYFNVPDIMSPVSNFIRAFTAQHFTLFAACILAQIPVSFVDRLITTFAGYGIYKLTVRCFGEF